MSTGPHEEHGPWCRPCEYEGTPPPVRTELARLALSWEREAHRRNANTERRDDPVNLLAIGIYRTCASNLRAAIATRPTLDEDAALDAWYRTHILAVYHSPRGQAKALADKAAKESWRENVRAALKAAVGG